MSVSAAKREAVASPRAGEEIGAGFFVFRRNAKTGRVNPSGFPFEHPDADSASKEAIRLANASPGVGFIVVRQVMEVSR